MTIRGREAGADLPYTGALGLTRREAVFVTGVDGHARRVEIVRSLNAATDPPLARAATDGSLHLLDDGSELGVPFVFHDPAARRFALVVPRARAHEELTLRADLLLRLAADTSAPLPAYVREARTVVGTEGLRRYLEEPAEDPGRRMDRVSQREDRLRDRAQDLTRREDEIRQRSEEIEVERSDVQLREQQLEARFAELLAREEALTHEERAILANKSAQQARERKLDARETSIDQRESTLGQRERPAAARAEQRERPAAARAEPRGGSNSTAEHPQDLGGFDVSPVTHSAAQTYEAERLEADPIDVAEPEAIEADEPVDDPTPLPTAEQASEAHATAEAAAESIEAEEIGADDLEPGTPTADVPAAWAARGSGVYAAVIDGEVRVWSSGRPAGAARLAAGGSSVVLQADPDSALPLALLTILDSHDERFTRVVLDLTRPDDRAVLESLGRDFRVRLEVISTGGRALGGYTIASPGEANAQLVLRVLSARGEGSDDARKTASDQLMQDGVPVDGGDPFMAAIAEETALATASGAERAVTAYEPLLDPASLERYLLVRGAYAKKLESVGKRVILAALRCGVALSPVVSKRALELAIAPDERALATLALNAFARSCEAGPDLIERSRGEALRAWGPLLAWAARVEAVVPESARVAMRSLFDADDPDAVEPPDARTPPNDARLNELSDDELRTWVDHPGARQAVVRVMVGRDATKFADVLPRAFRLLPGPAAGELAGAMLEAGDALGDVWVELVGSRRPVAACVAAAALAAIKLRRGLGPVLQRALSKDEPNWKLFGWAAGEFGAAVMRAVGRLDGVDPARLAWLLAHVIRGGGGRDVEKARTGSTKVLAEAASQATGLVDDARAFAKRLGTGGDGSELERAVAGLLRAHSRTSSDDDGSAEEAPSTS